MNISNITRIWFAALSLLVAVSASAARPKPYRGEIRISPQELQQQGDSLHIRFMCDAAGVKIPSRQSVEVVPLLIGKDTSIQMPVIAVKGRANYLLSRRHEVLARGEKRTKMRADAPYAVVKGYKTRGTKQVEYHQTMAFEPWMTDAGLAIGEDLCGCGLSALRFSVSPLLAMVQSEIEPQPVLKALEIFTHISYLAPLPEVKRGELSAEAMLDFVVSKTDIKTEYMNNAAVLKNISEVVEDLRGNLHLVIRDISVIGYASPEGTLAGNRRLSEGRAKALVDYLVPQFDYPRAYYHVEYGGENWSGLRDVVAQSEQPWKQQVIDIIDQYPVLTTSTSQVSRKAALFGLEQGAVYRYLVSQYYPHLRKAICKINYDIKPLDVRTAEALLASRPQDLNLHEIYQVALIYGDGSPKFAELLTTAVQLFPNDGTANLNAAAVALAAKDADTAERYLAKARKDCPEYENAMGVLLVLKADYSGAVPHLTKAAEAGLAVARTNLDELAAKAGVILESVGKNRDKTK